MPQCWIASNSLPSQLTACYSWAASRWPGRLDRPLIYGKASFIWYTLKGRNDWSGSQDSWKINVFRVRMQGFWFIKCSFHYNVSLGWLPPLSTDPGLFNLVFEPLDTFLWSCFCFLRGAQNGVGLCRTWAFPITPTSFALLIVVPESNQLSAGHLGPIFSSTHLFQGFLLAFSQKGLQCILDVQPYRKRYIVSWFHKIQNSLLPRLK